MTAVRPLLLTVITLVLSLACGGGSVDTGSGPADTEDAPVSTEMYEGTGAKAAIEAVNAKLGGSMKMLEIDIYPDHVEIQVQKSGSAGEVEQYTCDAAGSIGGPNPVSLMGGGDLSVNLFTLDGIALDKVPSLATTGIEKVGKGGHVGRISVKRGLPFDEEVQFGVFVEDDNDDTLGKMTTDKSGTFLELDTDY